MTLNVLCWASSACMIVCSICQVHAVSKVWVAFAPGRPYIFNYFWSSFLSSFLIPFSAIYALVRAYFSCPCPSLTTNSSRPVLLKQSVVSVKTTGRRQSCRLVVVLGRLGYLRKQQPAVKGTSPSSVLLFHHHRLIKHSLEELERLKLNKN